MSVFVVDPYGAPDLLFAETANIVWKMITADERLIASLVPFRGISAHIASVQAFAKH